MAKSTPLAAAICILIWLSSPALAGTKDDPAGAKLMEQGEKLYLKAQSNEDLENAARMYKDAFEVFEKVGDERGISAAANNLALIYKRWGEFKRAIAFLDTCVQACVKIKDLECHAQALNNLAQIYSDLGLQDKALSHAMQSLKIRRDIGNQEGEALSLHGLGYVHFNLGNYPEALKAFKGSLSLYDTLEDRTREGLVLNDIGDLYTKLGRYKEALESLTRSRDVLREVQHLKDEGAALSNIGVVYEGLGQFDEAQRYYLEALANTRQIRDPLAEGEILLNLGNLKAQQERYKEALGYFRACLMLYKSINVPTNWPNDLIGNLLMDAGDIHEAEPYVTEGGYNSSLGRLHLLKRDYGTAKDYFEKTVIVAESSRNANDLFQGYTGLAIVQESMGRHSEAAKFFQKAVEVTEEIRSGLSSEQRMHFFDVKVGGYLRSAPYEGYARVLLKMNKDEDAFKQSEYTKARSFSEKLAGGFRAGEVDVPWDVRSRDEELNNRLAALVKKRQEGYEKGYKEVVDTVEPEIEQAKKRLNFHIEYVREFHPLFAATKYPQPVSLWQTALNEGEWALVYDVTDAGLLIYLTAGRKLVKSWIEPVSRNDLEKLVTLFREPLDVKLCEAETNLRARLLSFDFDSGKKLGDILLGEILPHLPEGAPLIVIPDNCLALLPFEMLLLNAAGKIDSRYGVPHIIDAQFFGDRNPVSYYHSVTALTIARTLGAQKISGGRLLVMADPVFRTTDKRTQHDSVPGKMTGNMENWDERLLETLWSRLMGGCDFPRLSRTEQLAADLQRMFPDQTDIYTGFRASKAAFLNTIAPELFHYDKLVFVTHGYFGKDLPGIREPVLVLTTVPPEANGFITMSEIMRRVKTNANIVALTACQSGLGRHVSGEGTMGMGRAFQYAGAKSVLMSLWSVAEKPSVQLIEGFFRNLKEGKAKLEALRLARQEIRKGGYDHPFFWAPFILVGDTY